MPATSGITAAVFAEATRAPRRIKTSKDVKRIVTALLTRSGGCTRSDLMEALEWPSIHVRRLAKQCGLRLQIDDSSDHKRYFGHKPTITIRERSAADEPAVAPTEAPQNAPQAEGLAYRFADNHLHVIGPAMKAVGKAGLMVELKTVSDQIMGGKAFDIIVDVDRIEIVVNEKLVVKRNIGKRS